MPRKSPHLSPGNAQTCRDCPAADTFGAFADEIGPEGFQFRYQRMKAGHQDGPTLVTVTGDQIVGADGPLTIVAGPDGRVIQQLAYFAVHPAYRGRGHGRSLGAGDGRDDSPLPRGSAGWWCWTVSACRRRNGRLCAGSCAGQQADGAVRVIDVPYRYRPRWPSPPQDDHETA